MKSKNCQIFKNFYITNMNIFLIFLYIQLNIFLLNIELFTIFFKISNYFIFYFMFIIIFERIKVIFPLFISI